LKKIIEPVSCFFRFRKSQILEFNAEHKFKLL
jgi:hypothetical protein